MGWSHNVLLFGSGLTSEVLRNRAPELLRGGNGLLPKNSELRGWQVNPLQQGNVLFLDFILGQAHTLPYEEFPRSKKFANRILK